MDGLTKFEERFEKPRAKWSKTDWRNVAHELAGIQPNETRGRTTKTTEQIYDLEQKLRAAEFWRNQTIETVSVIDGNVGTVHVRPYQLKQNTATKAILVEALELKGVQLRGDKLLKKADALVRAIQVMQKNRRKK